MQGKKGAIFDLDGTILDTMHIWTQIDIDFLSKRNIKTPDDYVKIIAPLGLLASAEYTKKRFNLPESIEEIIKEWDDMSVSIYNEQVKLKSGAKEYLKKLKSEGKRLSVATASKELLFVPALKNNGIYDLFDEFTTVNEVLRGKGFSDVYEKAAEKIGLMPCDCVVFEDVLDGLRAAKNAGFMTVGVFDSENPYSEDEIKKWSDYFIRDFNELI